MVFHSKLIAPKSQNLMSIRILFERSDQNLMRQLLPVARLGFSVDVYLAKY